MFCYASWFTQNELGTLWPGTLEVLHAHLHYSVFSSGQGFDNKVSGIKAQNWFMRNVTFFITDLDLYFDLHFIEGSRKVITVSWGPLTWGLYLGWGEKEEGFL